MSERIETKAVLEKANGGTTRFIGGIRLTKAQGWCRPHQAGDGNDLTGRLHSRRVFGASRG
jgi:hypothetical protein